MASGLEVRDFTKSRRLPKPNPASISKALSVPSKRYMLSFIPGSLITQVFSLICLAVYHPLDGERIDCAFEEEKQNRKGSSNKKDRKVKGSRYIMATILAIFKNANVLTI